MSDSPLRRDSGSPLCDGRSANVAMLVVTTLILLGAVGIVTLSYNKEDTVLASNVAAADAMSGMPPLTTLPRMQ